MATGCEVGYNELSDKGQLFWRWPIEFDSPTKPVNLYLVAGLVFRIRAAAGDQWVPLSVLFENKAPIVADRELSVFGPQVRFDADKTSITLDLATLIGRCRRPTMRCSRSTSNMQRCCFARHRWSGTWRRRCAMRSGSACCARQTGP
ncbi:MAG: AraC family transcriptional regulator ligand-binding domain-containing protein [Hyphomicrobiaceae bacterium]